MVRFYTYLEVYLGNLGKSVSLSEFEGNFKNPHQTLKKHLEQFTKAKILKEEKKERLLNFLEKNALFLRLYHELSQFFKDSKILLFGSSVETKDYNDIDLLILSKNKNIKEIIKKFKETYFVKIHLVQTEVKDLTKTLIQEIKKKHIIFNNHEYFMEVLYR